MQSFLCPQCKNCVLPQLFCKKGVAFAPVIRYNEFSSGLYLTVLITTWRCRLVGRGRTTGNRVTVKSGSRVRISPSPPKKNPQKCGVFLCLCGLSGFLRFALIAYFLRVSAFQGHRKSTGKYSKISPPRWRGDSFTIPCRRHQVLRTKGVSALWSHWVRPCR